MSFDKDVKSYNLQSFDDGKYCLLVNGDMQSANLKESWFSHAHADIALRDLAGNTVAEPARGIG